jgi:hypothetical protein
MLVVVLGITMVVKVIVVAMIRNNGNSGDFRKITEVEFSHRFGSMLH